MICFTTAALVALASSVEAKSTTKPRFTSNPILCYDEHGNRISCPISGSKTTWIIIGVGVGTVALLAALYVWYTSRRKTKTLAWTKRNTNGAHEPVPTGESTTPLDHDEASPRASDQKKGIDSNQQDNGTSATIQPGTSAQHSIT